MDLNPSSLAATTFETERPSRCGITPRLVGRMATFHNDVYHRDIGTPAAYQHAQFNTGHLEAE